MSDDRAAFTAALAALEAAHQRLNDSPNDDAAFTAWCRAVEAVKALHQPIAERSLERARRAHP